MERGGRRARASSWCTRPASAAGGRGPGARVGGDRSARDVRFIAELIDTLKASYNIDPTRIYADGLSNGGGMAFLLSCTLSDRIAAVGLVASAQFLPWSACQDQRAVPMIAFHGTDDRFAPYHGGTSWVARGHVFPSIPTFTATWARRNRCGAKPVESAVAADVTRLEYTGCADDADVVLYTIHGGGHTWPGGGPMPEWFAGSTSTQRRRLARGVGVLSCASSSANYRHARRDDAVQPGAVREGG